MNAHTPITRAKVSPWERDYRAAIGSKNETWLLMRLHIAMEKAGDTETASTVYDLANTTDPYDRATFLQEMEETFLRWSAEDEWEDEASDYEHRTGRDPLDRGTPYWDKPDWIRNRVTDMMAEGVA